MATGRSSFPWRYLLLSYGLAWILWIPVALTGRDYQESPWLVMLLLLGVFGPGIAGIILTYLEEAERRDTVSGPVSLTPDASAHSGTC